MEFKTRVHTVYVLVGPTGCGKTHFTKNHFIPQLRLAMGSANIQHISSDCLRNEVLGRELHKHDPQMMYASEAAFSLLKHKLRLVTAYPINAEFVIIDTTGLSADFRKEIVEVSQQNNYRTEIVIFDYKNYDEYAKFTEGHDKKIVYDHIKRMREEVYPNLRSRDYDNVVKIKSKDFSLVNVTVEDAAEYQKQLLKGEREHYEIIGDVHGCYDQLIELLKLRGFTVSDDILSGCTGITPILIGDWIDKGRQCEQVIRFLHKNPRILLTKGNHENFVYKWLKGVIETDSSLEAVREEHFTTTEELKDNEELKQMFFELVERSREFWQHRDFIVTHAPCQNKNLGKMDSHSLKHQRNLRVLRRTDFQDQTSYIQAVEKSMDFLVKEGVSNHPKHIFGHHAVTTPFRIKNKIGIDTGCVNGGKLTCLSFDRHRIQFTSTKPMENTPCPEELIDLFPRSEQVMAFDRDAIEPEEWRRINAMVENRVNFVSGTMSPAEKTETMLESMERALDYYRRNGVQKVVLQQKWMGSRANLYLSNTGEKSYMVSRNGYRIKEFNPETNYGINLDAIYAKMKDRLANFMTMNGFDWLIIDGELMPWHALGSGLINDHYMTADEGIRSEVDLLKRTGFDEKFAELSQLYKDSGFEVESCSVSKNDLIAKHGHAKYETLSNLKGFSIPTVDIMKSMYDVYHRQMELYAMPAEVDYKPFALLKGIRADGSEEVFVNETESNADQFKLLSDAECCVIDLAAGDAANALADAFFANALTADHEGVVVKPDQVFVAGVAPYLKVRNPSYLSIIYGYDYQLPHKMAKLLRQKNTRKKMTLSVNEFDIGRRLLQIPRSQINVENNEYLKLVLAMIADESSERTLDPRL